MEEGIDALVTNVTQSSPSLNGPWGFLHALLPPFWSQQESSVDLSITGITMITILLQMFFSSLTIYVVVNIAIRCFSRFPFSEAARRQWLKDHDIHHRKDEDKRHYFSTKREIWKTIKLQISILFIVAIEVFGNVITKIYLFFYSFLFLILSKEHQEFEAYVTTAQYLWRPTSRPDPDLILCERSVVFMRHGESIWNLAFNRPISFWTPFRILYLLGWELLLGCERDSVILDSPLSSLGQYQAGSVLHWLQDEQFPTTKWSVPQGDHKTKSGESEKRYIQHKIINELNGNHEDRNCVIVVTSNLRRAISTALIAFNHRWNPSIDTASSILPCPKLYVHSFLQEATRNADGYSLRVSDFDSTQNAQPVSLFERNPLIMADRVIDISSSYASALDQSFDHGSKHMLTASLLQRDRKSVV